MRNSSGAFVLIFFRRSMLYLDISSGHSSYRNSGNIASKVNYIKRGNIGSPVNCSNYDKNSALLIKPTLDLHVRCLSSL
jgi:hypothetical protein